MFTDPARGKKEKIPLRKSYDGDLLRQGSGNGSDFGSNLEKKLAEKWKRIKKSPKKGGSKKRGGGETVGARQSSYTHAGGGALPGESRPWEGDLWGERKRPNTKKTAHPQYS